MQLSLSTQNLFQYMNRLAEQYIPDGEIALDSHQAYSLALERLEHNFNHIHKPYFQNDSGKSCFNHKNSDHMAMWLYILSNQCYQDGLISAAEKFFYINKIMHGLDALYAVQLPSIFLFVHPLGTVLGNACYQDYFIVYQNVTIGSDPGGVYPTFGKGCVLYSGASIINRCILGDNCTLGANAYLRNTEVAQSQVVYGQYPSNVIKPNNRRNIDIFSK